MSLAFTVLDEYRLKMEGSNLDAVENRFSNYGAYYTFLADTEKTIPGYQELMDNATSNQRTVSVVVGNAFNPTVKSARACVPSTGTMTSNYVTPSWTTIETAFTMVAALNDNNYVSYQKQFERQLEGVQRAFLGSLDAAAVAHLAAKKSVVNNAEDNPYTVTGDMMQVPKTGNDQFFNEYGSIAMANDLSPIGHSVIGSPRLMAITRHFQSQGAGNSVNLEYQFAGYNFGFSNKVTVATPNMAIAYLAPIGSLAVLTWVDMDCRADRKAGDQKIWTTLRLPLLDRDVGVFYTADCGSNGTGYERSHTEIFEFSLDYAYLSAYNSVPSTNPGAIYGATFLSS